jgi:sporulation related protein
VIRGSRFGVRDSRRAPHAVRLLRHWRKVFWLSVGLVVVASADVLVATYGPASRPATVETGASFSVSAGSFATDGKAQAFAAALGASGLPVFVRARVEDGRYQVLVGPYVSTDESERAQRKLAAWGLGESRLVVDDAMRARPQEAAIFGFDEAASNGVVMIAAGGMSSLVFEMQETPKAIELKRTSGTALDVEIGQTRGVLEPLALPDGVVLVQQLSVHSEGDSLRAHLTVPEGVEDRVRLEGRRVYLDLAFPKAPWDVQKPGPKGPGLPPKDDLPARESGTRESVARVLLDPPDHSDGRDQLDDAVARFDQIKPFLNSALVMPEPDVLAALAHSLNDLRATVERLGVSRDVETDRASLLAAIADASVVIKKAGDR